MTRLLAQAHHGAPAPGVYALICGAAIAIWLATYRLPFDDPARRRRIALRLAGWSGVRADVARAIFGTVLYLGLGSLVLLVLLYFAPLPAAVLVSLPPLVAVPCLLLAMLGCSSLNVLFISFLYRANPRTDVPREISQIQWIASILALPRHFRWIIPAAAALVEELVFRGAVFIGLLTLGSNFWVAWLVSTFLFTLGQVVLVSTSTQGFVMGSSSIALGTFGSLLIAATGSLIPAIILHMSFAGFYTNMSAASNTSGARMPPGMRL